MQNNKYYKIMKKSIIFGLFALSTSAIGLAQDKIAGADQDAHGCKASAGYTYSTLKKECIRSFEQKIQLKEIASKGQFNAAVVFNTDKSKAEIFLKEEKQGVVLTHAGKVWKNAVYSLTVIKGKYELTKNKKAVYKS